MKGQWSTIIAQEHTPIPLQPPTEPLLETFIAPHLVEHPKNTITESQNGRGWKGPLGVI